MPKHKQVGKQSNMFAVYRKMTLEIQQLRITILRCFHYYLLLHHISQNIPRHLYRIQLRSNNRGSSRHWSSQKRLANLFKHGRTSGLKRQDTDLGYHSQSSPLSPLPNQHGINGHVTNGLASSSLHRDLSIEEELENRLLEVQVLILHKTLRCQGV